MALNRGSRLVDTDTLNIHIWRFIYLFISSSDNSWTCRRVNTYNNLCRNNSLNTVEPLFFIEENVVSLFHWALFVLNFDFVSKKIAPTNTGNNISSMKRSRDFIKYINILLSSWEVPSLFSCFSSTSMRI